MFLTCQSSDFDTEANLFSLSTTTTKSLQLCLTLCDSIDGSPTGSTVPRILQARTLEWVAISFSSAWKWKVKVKSLSHVQPSATPWTAAFQAPPSMGFSRQEYWSGVPLPSLENHISYTKNAWYTALRWKLFHWMKLADPTICMGKPLKD